MTRETTHEQLSQMELLHRLDCAIDELEAAIFLAEEIKQDELRLFHLTRIRNNLVAMRHAIRRELK